MQVKFHTLPFSGETKVQCQMDDCGDIVSFNHASRHALDVHHSILITIEDPRYIETSKISKSELDEHNRQATADAPWDRTDYDQGRW